jgi:hypothetical protein
LGAHKSGVEEGAGVAEGGSGVGEAWTATCSGVLAQAPNNKLKASSNAHKHRIILRQRIMTLQRKNLASFNNNDELEHHYFTPFFNFTFSSSLHFSCQFHVIISASL